MIKFVLPEEFRGLIVFCLDSNSTMTPSRGADGEYTVTVPPNGKVKMGSLTLMNKWHKKKAIYTNGVVCPVFNYGETDPNVVALQGYHGASTNKEERIYTFVGTCAEATKAFARDDLWLTEKCD
ncbi:MAG: hypothetical protein JSS27_04090 [Planctomycetes bacterium]|nr:hypothetical protein [Planctomycetota bacterium]